MEKPKAKTQTDAPDTSYTTDLDELRITFRKEIPIDPLTEAKNEFDRNTQAITAKLQTETVTNRVFRKFFVDACPEFINDNCKIPVCGHIHIVPEVKAVRIVFERAQVKEIEEAYGVCVNYPKLFEPFFLLFAEMFIKKKDEDSEPLIGRMVMDCERTARTHQMYRYIVQALVDYKKMTRCDAIKLLMKYSTDSVHGQDEILQMVAETGADLIQFMDYLSDTFRSRTVPTSVLDKILSVCVQYQEPKLPRFLLNNLINKSPIELRKLNADKKVNKFMELQKELMEEDETSREEKCITLIFNLKN